MKLEKTGSSLTVRLIGEVNSDNAPGIVETLFRETEGITDLTFDLKDLEYISSAGLRMMLGLQKIMKEHMTVTNANDEIMEIFTISGFANLLNFA